MIHRFVHIGDTHLKPGERNATKRSALEQILAEASNLTNLAAFIWPGDLNDGRMSIEDRNFLADYIPRLARIAPTFIIPGNHDLHGDLDVFERLATGWPVYYLTRPDVLVIRTATGCKAAIAGFPYPSRVGLVAACVASEHVVGVAQDVLEPVFMALRAKLDESGCPLRLFVCHVNVGGSIVSSGQPNIGKEIELSPVLLDRLGTIPKLGNHIHYPQDIAGLSYAGSICGMDYGECEEKSYIVLEMDDDTGDWRIERKPLDVPRLYHVDGTLTRERFDWKFMGDSLMLLSPPDSGPAPVIDCAGCEVRVRVRFAAAEKGALDFDLIKAPFVGAKRLEIELIAEHTRAVRAPEVAAAHTIEEKLSAFVRSSGLDWSDGLQAKFAVLQNAPDGTAVLNAVESSLSGATSPRSEADGLSSPTDVVPDNEPQAVGR